LPPGRRVAADPGQDRRRRFERIGARGALPGGAGLWRSGPGNPAGTRRSLQKFDPGIAALRAAWFRSLDCLDRGTAPAVAAPRRICGAVVVSGLIALVGFMVFAARRLLTYLHLFQQEEYDGPRFLRWLVHSRAWDRRLSLALLAVFVAELIVPGTPPAWLFPALAGAVFLAAAAFERDPRH